MQRCQCTVAYRTIAIAACLAVTAAQASEYLNGAEAFLRECRKLPFAHIEAKATQQRWQPLADDMLAIWVPLENPTVSKGWIASEAPFIAFVISQGLVSGQPVEACTMASTEPDTTEFQKAIEKSFLAHPESETSSKDIVYKTYTGSSGGVPLALTLTLPLNVMGAGQITATIVTGQRIEN